METITEKVKKKLDISEMEDEVFRFTGIDVKKVGDKIEVSINNYANSLERMFIRDGKLGEILTRE